MLYRYFPFFFHRFIMIKREPVCIVYIYFSYIKILLKVNLDHTFFRREEKGSDIRTASLLSIFWLITPMHRLTFTILVIISILNGE